MSAKPAGTYCWTDLLPGEDQSVALTFYRELLGWTAERGPDEFGGYAMAHLGAPGPESAVAGINDRMGSEAPPQWTPYLATDDVDATLALVSEHGGTLAFGPHDIPGMGRTAYCVDPTGAGFALWQAGPFPGFGTFGAPGSFCWTELYSTDAVASRNFFSAILGLEGQTLSETEAFTYFQMTIPSNPEGRQIQFGVMQITPGRQGFPDEMSSTFRPYVSVEDVDAAVERAVALGGKVHVPLMDSPFGRMCTIADPDRADVILIDLTKATGAF